MKGTGSRLTGKWRIAHKLTLASVLMIVLAMLAGGVGLWQVITIGQTINDAREKQQQQVRSLELLAAGHGLVAAMDHMLVTQESLLASTEVIPSLGILKYHMEALQETRGEVGASDALEQVAVVYDELLQIVDRTNLLARQERWTEVGVALEQEIRPANEHMGFLIQQLVQQADRDVEAMAAHTQVVVRQALLLLAVLVVLTTVIAWSWRQFVFRGLSQSIGELRQGMERISIGDLDYELDVRTGDEIQELADSMERMRISMKAAIEMLKEQGSSAGKGSGEGTASTDTS